MFRAIVRLLLRFQRWRNARVRALGSESYIRFTPNFGIGFNAGQWRMRYARHHGLQLLRWNGRVWDKRWPKAQSRLEQRTAAQLQAGKRVVDISARPPRR